nr:hypothetical protein [Tanacetum cinerariifolium]
MQQTFPELMALCTSLQRVNLLEEREGLAAKNSGDDAPIKGRSMDEGEAATKRVSDNTEEMATILTSIDAATVLASGVVDVPTEDRKAVATKQSGEDALINGRSNNEGEVAAERISNDSKEIAKVLTSMNAATVLAGETNVPTGSGFIPTAGPPATIISTSNKVGPTASLIVRRRKGKEVLVESETPKNKRLQEQIDAQVARELEEQQERERI